jgi:RHS repeat-associated protein
MTTKTYADDAYRLIGTTQGLALGMDAEEFVSDGTVGTSNPGNWRSSYGYDAADNITQVSSQTNTASNWSATPNALNQIANRNSTSWVYDAAGNLLDDGARTYTWDAAQRLISITDKATGRKSEFIHDGQSRLTITKEYPAGSSTASETRYLWCGHKVCQARDGQDNITARYFDEGEIKTTNTGSTALYYTRDHLGSVMETTQASGKVLGSLDYGPYGEAEKAQGQLPDFRYAGMLHHAPTGLYLTHYRAYDPSVGRWLNRDPIEEQGGINLYGYVGGNPVSNIDPLGLATYMCKRNLDNVPFQAGPLFHQYICIPDGKGGQTCAGLGPAAASKMFDTPGIIEYEKTSSSSASCEKVADDDECLEKCIQKEFKKPVPNYSVDLSKGENCQTWANSAVAVCKAQCAISKQSKKK